MIYQCLVCMDVYIRVDAENIDEAKKAGAKEIADKILSGEIEVFVNTPEPDSIFVRLIK